MLVNMATSRLIGLRRSGTTVSLLRSSIRFWEVVYLPTCRSSGANSLVFSSLYSSFPTSRLTFYTVYRCIADPSSWRSFSTSVARWLTKLITTRISLPRWFVPAGIRRTVSRTTSHCRRKRAALIAASRNREIRYLFSISQPIEIGDFRFF